MHRALPSRGSFARPLAAVAAVVAFALPARQLTATGDSSTLVGLLVLPLLSVAVLTLGTRLKRADDTFDVVGIVATGWFLRMIGAYFRFRAPVDAVIYHQEGQRLAAEFRSLNFAADTGREFPGTGFIRWLSGLVHVVVFDNFYAAFLVFTTFSFIGVLLCYKALVRAVPGAHRYRYALLVFWWPSMVFWPSSLGKEAWMVLGIGITANGVSLVFTGTTVRGYVALAAGLTAMTLCRPHVALLALVGFGLAFVVRPGGGNGVRAAGKVLGVLLLVIGGSLLAGATADRLKIDSLGSENVQGAFDYTQQQTQQGSSSFNPVRVNTPLIYPVAAATVLFRPLPGEAPGTEGLLAGAEGLILIGLVIVSFKALVRLPRHMIRTPYVTFALGYVLGFGYVFSVIANFGILTRQRTQVLPMLFVLLCLPGSQRSTDPPDVTSDTDQQADPPARSGRLPAGTVRNR